MKISKSCFAVMGLAYLPPWFVNSGFIVGDERTMVVDAGPSFIAAQTVHGYAQNVKLKNKMFVINTEKHLDHISGNCFYREKGIDVYGYDGIDRSDEDLRQDINEWNDSILNEKRRGQREAEIFFAGTQIVNPNMIVEDGDTFNLGGVTAEILFTKGHTQTNISVYIREEKVLFSGDCIVGKYIPNLGAGNVDDWKMWIESLDKISELELEYVVPGHGNVIQARDIDAEIQRIRNILYRAIESGKIPA